MSTQQDCTGVRDLRCASRITLPAMYTLVRVRPRGVGRYSWTGYAYDISNTGMRFELDEAVQPGAPLDVRVMLPGRKTATFHASGRVVRMHDDADEPGPVRMGMRFDEFRRQSDRDHLSSYLALAVSEAAA